MLPNRLKKRRKELKLSQEYIAKKLGMTRQGYSHYETGRNEPDNETLVTLANILDCSADYLLGKTGNPNPIDKDGSSERDRMIHKLATEFPEADLMFEDLANMTAEDLEEVYEFIKFKRSQENRGD